MKSGQNPQQIVTALALGSSASNVNEYKFTCGTDTKALDIEIQVTTAKGSGTYATGASVLSALSELAFVDVNQKVIHDFKTPNTDIPNVAFMYDCQNSRGYNTPDVTITADGTASYKLLLRSKVKGSDFPITMKLWTAALSALYSSVSSSTASVTVIVTPIKTTASGMVKTQRSISQTLSGLTAIDNDVTSQLIDLSGITRLAFSVTEADFTNFTLQTPQVEYLSVPLDNLTIAERDTISGHISGLLQVVFEGTRVAVSKNNNNTTMKIEESTANQPTIYYLYE